ncbi:MAG TPA: hypothetical protein VH107_18530 [Lacipirellulaceae bacterium]|nr:hypothetical protein [Lacipirellulaceae bacterium]
MIRFQTFKAINQEDSATTEPVRASVGRKSSSYASLGLVLLAAMLLTGSVHGAQQSTPRDFSTISRAIDTWFENQPEYQPGDLITRAQIETVLKKLAAAGVRVPDAQAISQLGLANDSYLVRELTTPAGRRFMHKLSHDPGAYSHLDRLSEIPRGQKTINDLIREKDGDKLIDYLSTTKGGQKMGSMMGSVSGGVDLNKPTGRIYTVDDFEAVLKTALAKTASSESQTTDIK